MSIVPESVARSQAVPDDIGPFSTRINVGLGTEPTLPTLPRNQPSPLMHVDIGLQKWKENIQSMNDSVWSDPLHKKEFDSFGKETQEVLTKAEFDNYRLSIRQKRRQDDLLQYSTSRKRLGPSGSGLGLAKEQAERRITEKKSQRRSGENEKIT